MFVVIKCSVHDLRCCASHSLGCHSCYALFHRELAGGEFTLKLNQDMDIVDPRQPTLQQGCMEPSRWRKSSSLTYKKMSGSPAIQTDDFIRVPMPLAREGCPRALPAAISVKGTTAWYLASSTGLRAESTLLDSLWDSRVLALATVVTTLPRQK